MAYRAAPGSSPPPKAEVKVLIEKRFKAHVTALGKDGTHAQAAETAARYISFASEVSLWVPMTCRMRGYAIHHCLSCGAAGWLKRLDAGPSGEAACQK